MANAALLYADRIRTATLFASSFQPLLAPSLLQVMDLGRVWRTAQGVSSAWISADLGLVTTIGATALLAYGGNASATFRVRLSALDSSGADGAVYDSGVLSGVFDPVYRHFIHLLPDQRSARYLRIDVEQAGVSYLQAGGWVAGPLWQPARNYAHGFSTGWDDQDQITVTRGGVEWVAEGSSRRVWRGRFPALTPEELQGGLYEIGTQVKRRQPLLLVLDPLSLNLGRDSIFGRLQKPIEFPNKAFRVNSWDFEIAELV